MELPFTINWELVVAKLVALALFGGLCYSMGVRQEMKRIDDRSVAQAQHDRDDIINNINKRLSEIKPANDKNVKTQITLHDIGREIDEAMAKHHDSGCNISNDELRAFQRSAASTAAIVSGSGLPESK